MRKQYECVYSIMVMLHQFGYYPSLCNWNDFYAWQIAYEYSDRMYEWYGARYEPSH